MLYINQMYINACDFITLNTDILILMIIAFILAIWLIPDTKNESLNATLSNKEPHRPDIENDFDFMGTHESIPSQFDLAVAFASMGQTEKCLEILQHLALSSHPETRAKASKLIETVQSNVHALDSH